SVGVLLTMVIGADAISGERERGTLETLLLTPPPRWQIAVGKLLAALSLGRGVSIVGSAVLLDGLVGTLLAIGLAGLGLVVSGLSGSNRVSLSVSLFVLLALFAPTQLPAGARQGWLGDLLVRLNPVASGLQYVGGVLVDGHRWTRDLSYLISPALLALLAVIVLLSGADRLLRLQRGGSVG